MSIEDKVAVITGSSRGIGRAAALAFGKAGATVAITYYQNMEMAKQVESEILDVGGKGKAYKLDVTSRPSITETFNKVKADFGPVDILVNNAGIHQRRDFLSITDEDWDYMLNVNLKSAFMCIQEALPGMLKKGSGKIINISSIGGQTGGIHAPHYTVAKAGLINLTRSMAKLYSAKNIQSFSIVPGLVKTDMIGSVDMEKEIAKIPANRIAVPGEIAGLILFLCSSEAEYMSGQSFNFNGGQHFG